MATKDNANMEQQRKTKKGDRYKRRDSFVSENPTLDPVHGIGGRYVNSSDMFNGMVLKGTPYRLGQRIGGGVFGEVHMARNIKTNEQLAVKIESDSVEPSQLVKEWEFYKIINKVPGVGVPKVFHYGPCGMSHAMVLELLGPSLEQVFIMCERKFSLHTILMIAVQLISRLEYIHSCRIINQDIKPDNFLMCKQPSSDTTIFITDFGLAKFFMDPATRAHIPQKHVDWFVGTPRYVSLNMHMGMEQSRRDDLESLGYCLIYFLRGSLPWQGLRSQDTTDPYKDVREMKKNINLKDLCAEHQEFVDYMHYVRKLGFEQNPDYGYLKQLFLKRMENEGFNPKGEMDWANKTADKKRMRLMRRMAN